MNPQDYVGRLVTHHSQPGIWRVLHAEMVGDGLRLYCRHEGKNHDEIMAADARVCFEYTPPAA